MKHTCNGQRNKYRFLGVISTHSALSENGEEPPKVRPRPKFQKRPKANWGPAAKREINGRAGHRESQVDDKPQNPAKYMNREYGATRCRRPEEASWTGQEIGCTSCIVLEWCENCHARAAVRTSLHQGEVHVTGNEQVLKVRFHARGAGPSMSSLRTILYVLQWAFPERKLPCQSRSFEHTLSKDIETPRAISGEVHMQWPSPEDHQEPEANHIFSTTEITANVFLIGMDLHLV